MNPEEFPAHQYQFDTWRTSEKVNEILHPYIESYGTRTTKTLLRTLLLSLEEEEDFSTTTLTIDKAM